MKNEFENNQLVIEVQDLQNQSIEHEKAEQEKSAIEHEVLKAASGYTEGRDLANQIHGKLTFVRGMNSFLRAAEFKWIKQIKETELWRHLSVEDDLGSFRPAKSFCDYCDNGLKQSKGVIYEGLQNFDAFGEALDGLKKMGVERNHLRLLRKAPDNLIEQAIAAAEGNDKDALLEVIDDLAAKHAKEKAALAQEKEELAKQLERAQSDHTANQRLLEDKDRKINALDRELKRDLTPDESTHRRNERDTELQKQLKDKALTCLAALNEMGEVVEQIFAVDDRSDHLDESLYGDMKAVFRHALLMGRDYQIDPIYLLGFAVDQEKLDQVLEGELV